jgi:hypothetical protein
MDSLELDAFTLGVQEELANKYAGELPTNENLLPSSNKQLRWKYVRTKDGLKLSDGNLVYHFGGFPDHYSEDDHRVHRGDDDSILNFEKDHLSKGTAQIHRSSPDNVYMTLANGQHNPTFMLQHEGGKHWRYSPSKKFVEKLKATGMVSGKGMQGSDKTLEDHTPKLDATLLDMASFMKGAEEYFS